MNIISLFDGNVRKYPEKAFLRYAGHSYTYAAVQDLSRRAASVMVKRGVKAGDRVAMMCFNTPGFVIAMLGAWRIGAAVVPVNHKLQAPEVDYILEHAEVRLAIFDGALAGVAGRLESRAGQLSTGAGLPGHASFDELVAAAPLFEGAPPGEDQVAEVLYTSGTTGRPKGCLLSHRAVCACASTTALAFLMTRDERTLIAMPLWHSSPLNNWMLGTLYIGGTLVLLREYDPQAFLLTVQEERVTLYFGAPVSYTLPLHKGLKIADFELGSVRAWIYGGGPIGADTARQLAAAYRSDRFYQAFGMTETGPAGTVLYPHEQIAKAGSIGRGAMVGVDMKVVCDDGHEARAGEIGEIWLKAESMMMGYLNAPEATAEVIVDGWYRSGDLARLDDEGFLFVVDRCKDMIVTGGENVYSKEVEDVLIAHPSVSDVAVVGRQHPHWGETVVAFVVLNPQMKLDTEALNDFLASRLARYKIPREYVSREFLPRTPTGKLTKVALRDDVAPRV